MTEARLRWVGLTLAGIVFLGLGGCAHAPVDPVPPPLLEAVPPDCLVVTESGIHARDDVAMMRQHGVHAFLVGEAFMRVPDPGTGLRDLFA